MVKLPIKKYVMNESLSWEERYKQLEAHHNEETKWLISQLEIEKDRAKMALMEYDKLTEMLWKEAKEKRERENVDQHPKGFGC